MKISKQQAAAIVALLVATRPDWDKTALLNLLADNREQPVLSRFVGRCLYVAEQEGSRPAAIFQKAPQAEVIPSVDNPGDNGAVDSLLLRTDDYRPVLLRQPRENVKREPNPDPAHWRNRFSAEYEQGRQKRAEIIGKAYQAMPTQTASPGMTRPDTTRPGADTHQVEEFKAKIHCIDCGHTLTVSDVDPDSTVDDLVQHIKTEHPGVPEHSLIGAGKPSTRPAHEQD